MTIKTTICVSRWKQQLLSWYQWYRRESTYSARTACCIRPWRDPAPSWSCWSTIQTGWAPCSLNKSTENPFYYSTDSTQLCLKINTSELLIITTFYVNISSKYNHVGFVSKIAYLISSSYQTFLPSTFHFSLRSKINIGTAANNINYILFLFFRNHELMISKNEGYEIKEKDIFRSRLSFCTIGGSLHRALLASRCLGSSSTAFW